jgi:hypothetical protein
MTASVVARPKGICDRISRIKIIPYEGEAGRDADYDALIAAGKNAVPCLIQRVADIRTMRDPRMGDPGYAGITYRVGDTAFFLVAMIMNVDFPRILPPSYRRVWDEAGVYAYFKYVRRPRNRVWLQRRLRAWYWNVYLPSLQKSAA